MITGHLGVAAVARSRFPQASLLWLLPASIAPDLVDIAFALAGVCNPTGLYSHTVPAALLLATLVGGAAYLATECRTTGLVFAAIVLAHLPPDMISGSKWYWPGGPLIGLDLYKRPMLELLVELPTTAGGWWLLRRSAAAPRWMSGRLAFIGVLLVQAALDAIVFLGLTKPSACS